MKNKRELSPLWDACELKLCAYYQKKRQVTHDQFHDMEQELVRINLRISDLNGLSAGIKRRMEE